MGLLVKTLKTFFCSKKKVKKRTILTKIEDLINKCV